MKVEQAHNISREISSFMESNPEDVSFREAMRSASEAVMVLADRLNALALRVALVGAIAGAESDVEAALPKLYSLVDSAAHQMRLIQKLLPILQANDIRIQSRSD